MKRIIIGARGSRLSLVQAESVSALLKAHCPSLEIIIKPVITSGDRDRRAQLNHFAHIGVFVKELEEELLAGNMDIAVHSLKDMPTVIPPGLVLAAVTERADPRDVLVTRGPKLAELPTGAVIGTGSMRRSVQLLALRSDIKPEGIRGNIDTRIKKVDAGEFDGVVLAAAGLHRLGWSNRINEYFTTEDFLPAVGQGALGIQARAGDETEEVVKALNHLPTWQAVTAERACLSGLGGGCRAPIAALGAVAGNRIELRGLVAEPSGSRIIRDSVSAEADKAEQAGKLLAEKLLGQGAAEIIAKAECE